MPVRLKNQRSTKKYFKNGYVGGIGLTAFKESIGDANKIDITGISGSASYFSQVSMANFFSFGLQFGFIQKILASFP